MLKCRLVSYLSPEKPEIPTDIPALLAAWADGTLCLSTRLYDRHERPAYSIRPGDVPAWQEAILKATECLSLAKLLCTCSPGDRRASGLRLYTDFKPFTIVQEITVLPTDLLAVGGHLVCPGHTTYDEYNKTYRLFFNGITFRLNMALLFLLEQKSATCDMTQIHAALARVDQPMILLGSPAGLLRAGVGTELAMDPSSVPRPTLYSAGVAASADDGADIYVLGKLRNQGPITVICTGVPASNAFVDVPDDTVWLLPSAVGHVSNSGVTYGSQSRSTAIVPDSEHGCAWLLTDDVSMEPQALSLSAAQRFELMVHTGGTRFIAV
ncbi:MAG: hypothetical protein WC505_06170 [Patescibacteria group bacterium]